MSRDLAGVLAGGIRAARAQAGISQEELGRRLGLHQSVISKVERGVRAWDVAMVPELCAALGTTLDVLLQGADEDLRGWFGWT